MILHAPSLFRVVYTRFVQNRTDSLLSENSAQKEKAPDQYEG